MKYLTKNNLEKALKDKHKKLLIKLISDDRIMIEEISIEKVLGDVSSLGEFRRVVPTGQKVISFRYAERKI